AAVNAVFFNKIQEKPEAERAAYIEQLRAEYREDIDIYKLAGDLHIDAIVEGDKLRSELIRRFAFAEKKKVPTYPRKRSVTPV
ncbi:MAG TPA: carboxyl transferase domain-containing protein, partial [Pseudomonadota bacterium]|nr:carboxyl transferase domain-containing protein [Pseudomonadota bacterium]